MARRSGPPSVPTRRWSGTLGPDQRTTALRRALTAPFDIIVVGAGVVGAGVALDAVTRGLSTLLVEARDLASGTSSRSSMLIHGGLRYLDAFDVGPVREALAERGLMTSRLAPHLVQAVPFLYPLSGSSWQRVHVGAGAALYDGLALAGGGRRGLRHHRHLSRAQALGVFPDLRPDGLTGAVEFHDVQVDDARHTMTLVRTAAAYGGAVATRCPVVGFVAEGGRITGVRVRDLESDGEELVLRARKIISATGVWTNETEALAGQSSEVNVGVSKGVHLLVPRDRIEGHAGLLVRTGASVVLVIPWGRHWIIGTTDSAWTRDKAEPVANGDDIDDLLRRVNTVLGKSLQRRDVEAVYAGLRPLMAGDSEQTGHLSRGHMVSRTAPGLVVVAGGKYTTYRITARDAVDVATHALGRDVPSCSEHIPLLGADGFEEARRARSGLAARSGLDPEVIERLLGRYGSLIHDILGLVAASADLGRSLPGADDVLAAEVIYAVTHEAALHLDDVMVRRTRISIQVPDGGLAAAPAVAELMARVLGWGEGRVVAELSEYRARVAAERRWVEA